MRSVGRSPIKADRMSAGLFAFSTDYRAHECLIASLGSSRFSIDT